MSIIRKYVCRECGTDKDNNYIKQLLQQIDAIKKCAWLNAQIHSLSLYMYNLYLLLLLVIFFSLLARLSVCTLFIIEIKISLHFLIRICLYGHCVRDRTRPECRTIRVVFRFDVNFWRRPNRSTCIILKQANKIRALNANDKYFHVKIVWLEHWIDYLSVLHQLKV